MSTPNKTKTFNQMIGASNSKIVTVGKGRKAVQLPDWLPLQVMRIPGWDRMTEIYTAGRWNSIEAAIEQLTKTFIQIPIWTGALLGSLVENVAAIQHNGSTFNLRLLTGKNGVIYKETGISSDVVRHGSTINGVMRKFDKGSDEALVNTIYVECNKLRREPKFNVFREYHAVLTESNADVTIRSPFEFKVFPALGELNMWIIGIHIAAQGVELSTLERGFIVAHLVEVVLDISNQAVKDDKPQPQSVREVVATITEAAIRYDDIEVSEDLDTLLDRVHASQTEQPAAAAGANPKPEPKAAAKPQAAAN